MWIYDVIKHLIYIVSFTLIGCKDSCSCFIAEKPWSSFSMALSSPGSHLSSRKTSKVSQGSQWTIREGFRWMTTRPIIPLFQLVSLREITYLSCHPLLKAAGLSLYNFSSRRVKHTWLSWSLGLWPNFIGTLLKVMKLGKEWQNQKSVAALLSLTIFRWWTSVTNFGEALT